MDPSGATPKDPATLMWRGAGGNHDSMASSSDEDEKQAKNYQLFVAIRKRIPETSIIQEIDKLLNNGAEINAFNARHKTVLDIALGKKYDCLEKYLIGRGGKTAFDVEHGTEDVHEHIEVIGTNNEDILKILNSESVLQEERKALVRCRIDDVRRKLDTLLKDDSCNLTQDKLEKLNAKLKSELQPLEVIEALKRCGIDVNYPDSGSLQLAIDLTWKNQYYDAMLMLLEAQSKFPIDFDVNLDTFFHNPCIPEKLKAFVRERQTLHEWIQNDESEKIRKYVAVHKFSNFYNCDNKTALEIAVEFSNVDTLASLLGIILPSQEITISEEQSKLLQQLDTEGNTLLSVAAKYGQRDNVDFLIRCGIKINNSNKYEESAVDLAWHNEHFDVVHKLLEADSNYPIYFDMAALNVADAKDLRQFVEQRNKIHVLIKENYMVELEELVAYDKSTLFLNSEGKSALVTALESKRFEIYAFLKSIGLTFKNEVEQEYINKLTLGEKDDLKSAMLRKFPQIDKSHILYLMSKSRSKRPVENFCKIIENVYRYLDDIPEISIILQVLQYIDYLDLVFDCDKEGIQDINPTVSKCRGLTEYKDGRIFIGAGTDEQKVAGTLAHELTHLAVYFLYENDCNPFDKVGCSRYRFEEITDTIRETLQKNMFKMNDYEDNPETILAEILRYPENEHSSELIARVPHILAEYPDTGKKMLTREEYKLLFDYYNDKEEGGFIYRCNKVIENSIFIKPKKCIQMLNETLGKIYDMVKYGIHFEFCIDLEIFLKSKSQVFLLETKSTLLSTLNVYESLIIRNKKYSLQDSFVLEFNSYMEKEGEILRLMYSSAGKVLCLSYSCDSNTEELSDALNNIAELLNEEPDKKVIFIIQESLTQILYKLASMFKDNCEKSVQHKFTLHDFRKESQVKLLEREITFQEETIKLNKLINISDDDAVAVIDTNILVKLIKDERIEIGRRPPDTSELEGAYSELFLEIDINTLVAKLLVQNLGEHFIISGISGSKKQDSLVNCLLHKIADINKIYEVNNLKCHIEVLDVQELSRNITECIQVAGEEFKVEHFKQVCHNYSSVKIYWIHRRYENDEYRFILQRIYNPDFYVTGKRLSREVVIENSVVKELYSSELTEKFIITMNKPSDMQKWVQLQPEQEKHFNQNMRNNKINFVYLQDGAEDYFPESIEANQTVHLLKLKDGHLIWYKTFGSLNTLIKYRAKDYKNIEPLIEDNDATKMIQDNKVCIIAGDPGTGKSTIITRMYNSKHSEVESVMQSHWVIKLNLKDHVPTIKNMTLFNNALNEIIEILLLADKNLSHDTSQSFAQGLICMSLQKENFVKPLLILFDGFDEVLDATNRCKIITFLQYLKDKTYAKFCITTRLHYEKDLEGTLSTFAMKLEPMDDSTIHKFITKSLSNRLGLKISQDKFTLFFDDDGKRMLKYSVAFVRKMREVFKEDITKFIGTPLQLYLMLENSVDSFLEWMKDDSKDPDFSYFGNDLWEVYENFVHKKYDYFSKVKKREKEEIQYKKDVRDFDKYHSDLALSFIIFKSDLKESLKDIQDIVLSVGIVRSEDNLSFIHPTFAEYFAAKAFLHWIRKWKAGRLINFSKQEYFFTNILQAPDYRVIRTFLNAKLLKEKDYLVVLERVYLYYEGIVFSAAQENHVGIAKFVFDNLPYVNVNVCINGERVLNIAANAGHLEIVKYLIKKGADVNAVERGETALTIAAESGHLDITNLLIDKGANVNARDQLTWTPLTQAAWSGNLEITKLLIDNGADLNFVDNWSRTALFYACRQENSEIVKLLIDKGANVNAKDQNGETPLTAAASFGHLEITKLLIDEGADFNSVANQGHTALFYACKNQHLEIIKLLIDKGANVNAKDQDGETPLTDAASFGHLEITKLLIDEGADFNSVDNWSRTALFYACRQENSEIVKLLIDKGANVNAKDQNGETPLTEAASFGHLEITKLLIDEGADFNSVANQGHTALFYAFENERLKIVKLLIDKGANVNAKDQNGETPLTQAAWSGNLEITKLLIDNGADFNSVDNQGCTALFYACRQENSEIVKLLIDKGANVNAKDQNGETPFTKAALNGHLEITKLLLDEGADFNSVDNWSRTALFYACRQENSEIVKLLIDKGANVNAKDQNGETPLTEAASFGHLEITKLLIDEGADFNSVDNWSRTALFYACRQENSEIVKLLIDKGANVNAKDQNGETPLTEAASFGHLEITKLLIDEGADFNSVDNQGHTALFYACENQHLEIIKLLIDKGANVNAKDQNGETPFTEAALIEDLDMIKFFRNEGADFNTFDNQGHTALFYAENRHLEIIKLLIDKGANVNARDQHGKTLLIKVAAFGLLAITKFLIDEGADVNVVDYSCQTALIHASYSGYFEIVKLLLDRGADSAIVNQDGKTALLVADELGYSDIVTLLKTQKQHSTTVSTAAEMETFENSGPSYRKKRRL